MKPRTRRRLIPSGPGPKPSPRIKSEATIISVIPVMRLGGSRVETGSFTITNGLLRRNDQTLGTS